MVKLCAKQYLIWFKREALNAACVPVVVPANFELTTISAKEANLEDKSFTLLENHINLFDVARELLFLLFGFHNLLFVFANFMFFFIFAIEIWIILRLVTISGNAILPVAQFHAEQANTNRNFRVNDFSSNKLLLVRGRLLVDSHDVRNLNLADEWLFGLCYYESAAAGNRANACLLNFEFYLDVAN